MDGYDLRCVLDEYADVNLKDLLRAKLTHLNLDGEPFWSVQQFTGVWRILDLRGFHLWCKCNNMVKKPRRSSLVEQKTPVSSNLYKSFKIHNWLTSTPIFHSFTPRPAA
jgi:hypothetical protein